MARWQPDARERLERAAIELFTEQGFADTTVPQITARAGLTTRTFFRYFADKREVLFGGEEQIPERVARMMAEAPAEMPPMELVTSGLAAAADTLFEGRREHLRARRAFVRNDDGVQERELRKFADLADAVSAGFRQRGVDELTATLTARIAVTAFSVAITRWLDADTDEPLAAVIDDTLRAIRALVTQLPG